MRIIRLIVPLLLASCLCCHAAVHVSEHVLRYLSVDQRGDSLVLSGKVTVPQGKSPRGIILITHYTIYSATEAPSVVPVKSNNEAKPFYKDYVLVMPDYIGYGATIDSAHPYLNGELTAQNCVDMYLASQQLLDSLHTDIATDSLYVVGYSQGGATALWTLRLLEEQYADRLTVKGCFAGSGPYDIAATYDYAVANNDAGLPVIIPMLLMGTSVSYGLDLQQEDFFTPALSKAYETLIEPKEKGLVTIFFRMPNSRLDYWMTAYGRDKSMPQTRRMYEGLLKFSLVHYPVDNHPLGGQVICPEWRPKAPTLIFHSTTDNVVSFFNAEHLYRCFREQPNIRYDFGNYGDHLRSLHIFQKRILQSLKRDNLCE